MEAVMQWIDPGLDGLGIVLLTAVLWRLGRDPGAVWGEHEQRLQVIFDDLRALVAQSEGLARDLDAKLALREERLQALWAQAQSAPRADGAETRPAPARGPRVEVRDEGAAVSETTSRPSEDGDPAALATRIEALAAAGTAVEEIARRVGVAAAEVRLVIGLTAARAARRRATTVERRPDATH